jgi:hypothetical protein
MGIIQKGFRWVQDDHAEHEWLIGRAVHLGNSHKSLATPLCLFLVYEQAFYKPLEQKAQLNVEQVVRKRCLFCNVGNLRSSPQDACTTCDRRVHSSIKECAAHFDQHTKVCASTCVVCELICVDGQRCRYCGRLCHKTETCDSHEDNCFRSFKTPNDQPKSLAAVDEGKD